MLNNLLILVLAFNFLHLYFCCDKFDVLAIQNAIGLSCSVIDGIEYSEYECQAGHEFLKDQTKRKILSNNGELLQKFTCKPQGCKNGASPSASSIGSSFNIEFVSKYCDPAYLSGYCKPVSSYVDFKCKDGFSLDERFGFLRVKCLTSYLWDTIPICKKKKEDNSDNVKTSFYYTHASTSLVSYLKLSTELQFVKFCSKYFPIPKNHDYSKIVYNLKKAFDSSFQPDSFISFECLPGYFIQNDKTSQMTVCNLNGSWSLIENCELHKCLRKVPQRPLNGRRSIKISLTSKGLGNFSVVKFSCNDHFQLSGHSESYCKNYEWENKPPSCVLRKNLCFVRPPIFFQKSVIKSLTKVRTKFEHNYRNSSNLIHFTEAMYTCLPGFTFGDLHDLKYEYFDRLFQYKKVHCIGENKWESIPECHSNRK